MNASCAMPLKAADAFSVAGKVIIVTGAGGNVGGGICEVFAANGARLVCSDRADDRLTAAVDRFKTMTPHVAQIPCDLTEPRELKALIDQTLATFGTVDGIINCGALPASTSIFDEDIPDFDRLYHTNVRSIWLLTKYAIEPMRANGGGSIVNIASINGHRALFFCSLYAGTKAAVLAMTKELAVELAPWNIRLNTVSPGLIPTPHTRLHHLISSLNEPYATQIGQEFLPRVAEVGTDQQPIGRKGHGNDIGMACLYLCSPAASFVTGEDIVVDGGKSLEMHEAEPRFAQQQNSFFKSLRRRIVELPDDAWRGEMPKWVQRARQQVAEAR